MMITLEQVFFGRGPRGYAVLGATSGGEPFRADVVSLCEELSSPSDAKFKPFLVSRPCRGSVLMVKVSRGENDSVGRSTMFFHVLIGSADELSAAQVDAIALEGRGLFVDKLPQSIEQLKVDGDAGGSRPTDIECHDLNGNPPSTPSSYRGNRSRNASPVRNENPEGGSTVLKISLMLNVILIAVGAWLLLQNPQSKPAGGPCAEDLVNENRQLVTENTRLQSEVKRLQDTAAKVASGDEARNSVVGQLRKEFEAKYLGRKHSELELKGVGQKYQDAFSPYVRFVNEVILDSSSK